MKKDQKVANIGNNSKYVQSSKKNMQKKFLIIEECFNVLVVIVK